MNEQQLARGLGWFSIGLGLAEILAPRKVSQAIGVGAHDELLRTMGLREIASGVGILSSAHPPANWLWSRVAGDVMDLSMLGSALAEDTNDRRRVTTAIIAVAGVTVLDVMCSVRASQRESRRNRAELPRDSSGRELGLRRGKVTHKSITLNRPPEEIYRFWRNFENLPRFMTHVKSVTVHDDTHSHWVAKGPAGSEVEWDAEVIADEPNELISWRSLPGSMIETAGTVRFERATGGRGTVLRVDLQYRPPGGAVGATVAKLLGQSPEKQIPVDLLRIKQLLETGEIARTEGQPAGRERSTSRKFDAPVRA